jgi:hypothetical protein
LTRIDGKGPGSDVAARMLAVVTNGDALNGSDPTGDAIKRA